MFQYRQVLPRLCQGDSERDIARARLMGRRKVAAFRALAASRCWLERTAALPEDAEIAAAIGTARRARSTISSAEPTRTLLERWHAERISSVVIHAASRWEHGYLGSCSSGYRLLAAIHATQPPAATVPLGIAPAEFAQVEFGAGPLRTDAATGRK